VNEKSLVLAGEKVRNYRPTLKLQCRGQSNYLIPCNTTMHRPNMEKKEKKREKRKREEDSSPSKYYYSL